MFDILTALPLFKGATHERMAQIVGTHKFHFLKYSPGQLIFEAGAPCSDITFIISGSVRIKIENSDGRFAVSQTLEAPDVISPDFMFGKITSYPGSVTSVDTVSLLRIEKQDYLDILTADQVFMFNYLNLLSMNAQKALEGILAVSTGSIPERIAFWISALTQTRAKDIEMECRQRDLVSLFGLAKSSLKAALEEMKGCGLIDYTPFCIRVHDRRALLSLLHNHSETTD